MFYLKGTAVVGLIFTVFSPISLIEIELCDLNCWPAAPPLVLKPDGAPIIEYCPKMERVPLDVPLSLWFMNAESSVDSLLEDF
jgi:hypothetical protein